MAMSNNDSPKKGIAELYDDSSTAIEEIWGEHMHHGFYDTNTKWSDITIHSAQIRMIQQALLFSNIVKDHHEPSSVLDVGCGFGGSSRYIAANYERPTFIKGITISPMEIRRANALTAAQGLSSRVSFEVGDAMAQPFPDNTFDLVWSMESAAHMPDKPGFVAELVRVAAPGGTVVIVTWCHRDGHLLEPWEKRILGKICDALYMPEWASAEDYERWLEAQGMEDIKRADWTEHAAPFCWALLRSTLTWKGITCLFKGGWKTLKGFMARPFIIQGYNKGLIKFAIITCRKPKTIALSSD